MKKYICLIAVFFLTFTFFLASCGDSGEMAGTGKNDGKVIFTGEEGEEVSVEINVDTDISSYVILREDNAADEVIDIAMRLRDDIKNKAGADVSISTASASARQIIVSVDEEMGGLDFSITAKAKKIYLKGGTADTLTKAVDIFVRNFISGTESALLVPAGEGYSYERLYFFDKLTVEGVDITEFAYYSAPGNETIRNSNIDKSAELAEKLNDLLISDLIGKELPTASKLDDEGHHIVFSCYSTDVNPYSVEIKDGNIYFSGSFLSVETAVDAFVSEILGYTEGTEEHGKTLDITSSDSMSGSMGLTVPYTKSELLELFAEANERDDMVITGTHTYGNTNGDGIQKTVDNCIAATGESVAIMEIDVGHYGPNNSNHQGEDIMREYDVSMFVSEGMKHVSEGGIMAIVAHLGNPLNNGDTYYRGYLGDDSVVDEMLTEGTELNASFRATLDSTLRVIKAYSDNGIPIMFRPFHEMNADWFWWCALQGSGRALSADAMVKMWRYVYDIVNVEMGCDNVLWIYSTSTGGSGKKDVLYSYPGDDYVDIVGLDWYTSGNREYNSGEGYSTLMTTGKPVALTETGPGDNSVLQKKDVDGRTYFTYTGQDMLDDIKQMIAEGLSVSYFATWVGRTVYNLEGGEVIMQDPIMISREDLAQRWAEN